MPWNETCAMDRRTQFIAEWLSGDHTKRELCEAYGISRPTGDKWISRYQHSGALGLLEHSRAPHRHPNAVPEALRERIFQMKLAHRGWGPKKVMDRLRVVEPGEAWPADSTAGELLKRAGMVKVRRGRVRSAADTQPFADCGQCNAVWSADFKGDFALGDARRCYPLTVSDNYSRYLLQCRALPQTSAKAVWPWFERVFREYGLPQAIRSDNGAPFASLALGGISELSKWWIRLGIKPERIRPGCPSQNGRHERMHRTLKAAATRPAAADLSAQQQRFDAFVAEYNWERSHESLERRTPGDIYQASPRRYPSKLPPVEYGLGVTVRQVRHNGQIKWRGDMVYLSQVLAGESVALRAVEEDQWEIRYSFHLLGVLDKRQGKILRPSLWHGAK